MPVVAGLLNNWVLFRDCETDMWCCCISSRTIRRLSHTLDIDGEFRSDVHKENIELQLNSCYCWGGKLTNKMKDPVTNLSPTSVWQKRVKNNMLLLPEIEKISEGNGGFQSACHPHLAKPWLHSLVGLEVDKQVSSFALDEISELRNTRSWDLRLLLIETCMETDSLSEKMRRMRDFLWLPEIFSGDHSLYQLPWEVWHNLGEGNLAVGDASEPLNFFLSLWKIGNNFGLEEPRVALLDLQQQSSMYLQCNYQYWGLWPPKLADYFSIFGSLL